MASLLVVVVVVLVVRSHLQHDTLRVALDHAILAQPLVPTKKSVPVEAVDVSGRRSIRF
jgi:hypothetical protein